MKDRIIDSGSSCKKVEEKSLPEIKGITIQNTIKTFLYVLSECERRGLTSSDKIDLGDEFEGKGDLTEHIRNLDKAISFLAGIPRSEFERLQNQPRTGNEFAIAQSIVLGLNQRCAKDNLVDNVLSRGITTTNVDHLRDAVKVLAAYARINNITIDKL